MYFGQFISIWQNDNELCDFGPCESFYSKFDNNNYLVGTSYKMKTPNDDIMKKKRIY